MGELHLEILKDRMLREFAVAANTGKPMVAYHETITDSGTGESEFDREIGGKRQFALIKFEVEPMVRGSGNKIEFEVSEMLLPRQFRSCIEEGIKDGIMTGVIARYPVIDIMVRVTGGKFDPESSTDIAFKAASVMAFRQAVLAAKPAILEPIMILEITIPGEFTGDVIGDLNGRRGRINEMGARGPVQVVRARVPLTELFGYSTVIRSLSKGRASYTMEPDQFEIVPDVVKEKLIKL